MSALPPDASTSPPTDDAPVIIEAPVATMTTALVVRHVDGAPATQATDALAVETPIALRYNGQSYVVMMASPADLGDFAFGFSLAEGIVETPEEIRGVTVSPNALGLKLAIDIPKARADALEARTRHLAGRSSCGLCGVSEIEAALRPLPVVDRSLRVTPTAIDRAVAALPTLQVRNRPSGALHAAAFAAPNGDIVLIREDIGRHNALDKLLGALARAGLDPADGFVVVTSRCSTEMVQKAATAGAAILVAVSAPTALAVELATTAGLTVCAFARGAGCNVYSRPERIIGAVARGDRLDPL